jgi:hypothetical protein
LAFLVGELTGMLDEEARLAHELAGLLGQHLERTLTPVVAIGGVLVVVVIILLDDHALFQDHIEAGLDVVAVVLVIIVVVLVLFSWSRHGCCDWSLDGGRLLVDLWRFDVIVVDGILVVLEFFVEILEVLVIEVFGPLGLLVELVVEIFFWHRVVFLRCGRWVDSLASVWA